MAYVHAIDTKIGKDQVRDWIFSACQTKIAARSRLNVIHNDDKLDSNELVGKELSNGLGGLYWTQNKGRLTEVRTVHNTTHLQQSQLTLAYRASKRWRSGFLMGNPFFQFVT